jgi:hypothetical protein
VRERRARPPVILCCVHDSADSGSKGGRAAWRAQEQGADAVELWSREERGRGTGKEGAGEKQMKGAKWEGGG